MTRRELDNAIREVLGFIPTDRLDAASKLIDRLTLLLADDVPDLRLVDDEKEGRMTASRGGPPND